MSPEAYAYGCHTQTEEVILPRTGATYDVRRAFTTIFGVVIALAACAGSEYDSSADASDETSNAPRVSAVLFVERSVGAVTSEVQVGARFQRIVGLTDDALPNLVGTPLVPQWVPSGVPSHGLCVTQNNRAAEAASEGGRAEVRLLDVGAIEVRTGMQDTLRLSPRRFPDLWNVVSGVFYGAEAPLPLGRWRFAVEGGENLREPLGDTRSNIGRFEVEAESPEELLAVRVGGAPLPTATGTPITLRRVGPNRGGSLPVRWTRGKNEDRVSIVFDGDGGGTIVCGARDDGAFDVDPATMDRVAEALRSGGTVSVHRVRARAFTAAGIDSGALVFDLSVRARARVE